MKINKYLIKTIISLFLGVCLIISLSATVLADGSVVTYNGTAHDFIFTENDSSPTNIFSGFENIMPGDTITQTITIKNDVSKNVKVKLYLRSNGASSGSDFLSKMNLTVAQDGGSNLFSAPANESGNLTDWVCLGTFYSGAEIKLNLTITAPQTLDNAYQNANGAFNWEFTAEELPISPDDPKAPTTGDTTNIWLYGILIAISIVLIILIIKTRKNKEDEVQKTQKFSS